MKDGGNGDMATEFSDNTLQENDEGGEKKPDTQGRGGRKMAGIKKTKLKQQAEDSGHKSLVSKRS